MQPFSIFKDTDRMILMNLDSDKDLLNACKVSEYTLSLCNEDFFRNRMQQKYPEAKKYKDKNLKSMKWKQYYLLTVYYIDKLKREFDFDFLSTSDEAEGYYNLLKKIPNIDILLERAAQKGWLDLVKHAINKGSEEYYGGFLLASTGTDFEKVNNVVKYLASKFNISGNSYLLNKSIEQAAIVNNIKLIEYFFEKNEEQGGQQEQREQREQGNVEDKLILYNYGLSGAVRGGHDKLIDFFISKGANNWNLAILGAAYAGREDLVFRFITKINEQHGEQHGEQHENYFIDVNNALQNAATSGNLLLVKYFISLGADNFNEILVEAGYKNPKIVLYVVSKGATNLDDIIDDVIKYSEF